MNKLACSDNTNLVQSARNEPATLIDIIGKMASDDRVDVDKLERLLQMKERLDAKESERAFNAAMSAAQADMRPVAADAENPKTLSKYASYAALDKAMRPIYTRHGFALSFDTGEGAQADWVRVVCYVSHRDGHSKTYHADMPADGKGAKGGDVMTKTHAAGSAMSYGMRYLLKMIFNVAVGEDDDDGNRAGVETITAEQAANLQALIEEVGANKAGFLRAMNVTSLDEIPARLYQRGVKALEAKRVQK